MLEPTAILFIPFIPLNGRRQEPLSWNNAAYLGAVLALSPVYSAKVE